MAASVSVTITIPKCDKRHQEVFWADRALSLAAQAIRSAQGTVTAGNISYEGTPLGSWAYTWEASS